jgi:hypothetical protein
VHDLDDDEVVAIGVVRIVEVTRQFEPAARLQPAAVAGAGEMLAARLDFLHAQARSGLGLRAVRERVRARVFVRFDGRYAALPVQRGHLCVFRHWLLEIEAGDGRCAFDQPARGRPLADPVFLDGATVTLKRYRRVPVDGGRRRRVVAQDQLVARGVVLVPIAPAGRLPAPVQIIMIAFVELAGVRHARVVAGDPAIP